MKKNPLFSEEMQTRSFTKAQEVANAPKFRVHTMTCKWKTIYVTKFSTLLDIKQLIEKENGR